MGGSMGRLEDQKERRKNLKELGDLGRLLNKRKTCSLLGGIGVWGQ